MLIWARDRAGLSLDDAAARLDLAVEKLWQWEQGTDRPSIAQLRKVGEVYKRPLAIFFLPEPPQGFDPQREFRRLSGVTPRTESPELRLALRMALFRREAARELYERLGETIPESKVVARPQEDEEIVGQRIRESLGISWKNQLAWTGAYAALSSWRSAIEGQGILVFQTSEVEFAEMRGTSIPHGPLPVIVLNSADAPHGRIFTLIHEYAHILLGAGGHESSPMEGQRLPEDQVLERASNRFAAAALMPRREFLAEASNHQAALAGDEDGLRRFANRIKISPEAILRRLVALQKVPASLYRQKRHAWQLRPWYSFPETGGGPPIEVRVVSSIGRPFVSLVLEGYQRNAVSSADVVDYLGVQLKHLSKIARHLLPEPGFADVA
jgi:Zn-dependent peptidase ImmA (M78 family)/transcriptional regulator with XRE-family HTH domain